MLTHFVTQELVLTLSIQRKICSFIACLFLIYNMITSFSKYTSKTNNTLKNILTINLMLMLKTSFSPSACLCVCLFLTAKQIYRWWHIVRINKFSSLSCVHSFSLPIPPTPTQTHTFDCSCCFITNRPWRETFFLMNIVNTNRTTVCHWWAPFLIQQTVRPLAVSHLNNLRSIALTTAPAGCKIACYHFNGSPL